MRIHINNVAKIRFLLFVLTLGFFTTAVTIRLTFDRNEVLLDDARNLEARLQEKESIIHSKVADQSWFDGLKMLGRGGGQDRSEAIINELTEKNGVFLYTFSNNDLLFWSSEVIVPQTDVGILEGSSMIHAENGWYHALKFSDRDFSTVFLIPVKWEFNKTNSFLRNQFASDLIKTNNLDIAEYDDRNVYNIRSQSGQYLFSVKLSVEELDSFYLDLELLMWLLGIIFSLIGINVLCSILVRKGRAWLGIVLFGALLAGLRYADLHFSWLSHQFNIGLFDPRHFAASFWFPHLGGLLFNLIFLAWFLNFVYINKSALTENLGQIKRSPFGKVVFVIVGAATSYGLGNLISSVFQSLILNSDISFNVASIVNLTIYSWLGILALCLAMTSLMLFVGTLVHFAHKFFPNTRQLLILEVCVILFLAIFLGAIGKLNPEFFLISCLVVLCTWYTKSKHSFQLALVISILLLLGTIAALKHNRFQQIKRQEAQKMAIQQLEAVDDIDALALFHDLEQEITQDPEVINYFMAPNSMNKSELQEHIQTVYLSGYLSKYDFAFDTYNWQMTPIGNSVYRKLEEYRDRVISGAIRVTEYFYRGNSNFGNFQYFAQFPIFEEGDEENQLGLLLLELNHRSFGQYANYPLILADNRIEQQQNELIADYSFAIYRNGSLLNQSGKYVYPTVDSLYQPMGVREFKHVGRDQDFSHMAYMPNSRDLIVLSKPEQSSWMQLATLSFFFLVFFLFFVIMSILRWVYTTLDSHDFNLRNLRWSLLILNNRILYSTRIQMFMVVAVVFTLICTGIITFFSVGRQFAGQQERTMMKLSSDVAKAFESKMILNNQELTSTVYGEIDVIAKSIALDVNLYDVSGKMIYTTQPRIYDLRLQSEYINALAYVHLNNYGRSRYIQDESIGRLHYTTAFSTIKNADYETIAFLSLPNYGSYTEFDRNIGGLLNTLINIYALVILVLGLFAVFVANTMTVPLLLVQRSLAKTKIGSPNEPIFWKRNDEIGSLIREYNLMIAELEESANKIVRSERESAWREMAKQVAHEIKNPLTPLKLGMQHLEKSWRDQDPSFESRFKRFSASFIEQIDSLTHIASEFSDFAKMPDTQLEDVNLLDIIQKSADSFKSSLNLSIKVVNLIENGPIMTKGDKDQLLRSFNNLIKNAIEASISHRKCKIQIRLSKSETRGIEELLIEFTDNGMGINVEARQKMFQPNFTTKSSGTGLGLAFVKKAIEGMGGSISYKTAIGKGTTFFIKIPLEKNGEIAG